MAILEGAPGIRVTIVSQGKALKEYEDDDGFRRGEYDVPVERISTTYIECVSDEEFRIELEITPDYNPAGKHTHLSFSAYVDGMSVARWPTPKAPGVKYYIDAALTRLNKREISCRTLKFSQIRKVDDADSTRVKSDAKLAANLGEIIVYVHHATEKNSRDKESGGPGEFQAVDEISEKALKGKSISHSISFGAAKVIQQTPSRELVYPDGRHSPLGIFRFKYRSREALQQELIIARSPSPEAVASPINARDPNVASGRVSAQERLIQLKREIEQIKSEVKDEEEDGSPRGRKRRADNFEIESCGRAYKTSRHESGMLVVDLTDD
ncbi:uncharacterized protein BP5553_08702 [Venustampulla echinocandica]|uniref:DUF7918 domain-containing protein n=1 Tax=Venustampulla echinocandica TaxID=2656787 RepID=A0A370TEZ5_9HELO|nr:uncharacterized protein BP5553_08702 [Venustampulla echinocandica]RDL33263.1 hypothetical protein BP5553_08702 [Venustampulla echinocandica]